MKLRTLFKLTALSIMAITSLRCSSDSKEDPIDPEKPDEETIVHFNPSKDKYTINEEFRGVWIATVMGIDWPTYKNAAKDKTALQNMIKELANLGCNVVFLQLVSNQDAIYPSDILPWSHVLTGTQGQDPGYDPLQTAIEACHLYHMQIHGWLNPLRAGSESMERASNHVVLQHPDWIKMYKTSCFLDPAQPEVREHLASVIDELLTKYDLDGIHIDDYFYPDGFRANNGIWDDSEQYNTYKNNGGDMSKDDWRYSNINAVVKAMHTATHQHQGAIFGVSPAGRVSNTQALYADPSRWVAAKSIDYLIPQIYWYHGHPTADFTTVMKSWKSVIGSVPMYTGLAAYRLGETGFASTDEFQAQVNECREASWVQGHCWYSAKWIIKDGFKSFLKNGPYSYESLPPVPDMYKTPGLGAPKAKLKDGYIVWDAVEGATDYIVYQLVKLANFKYEARIVARPLVKSYKPKKAGDYAVMAIDGNYRSGLSEIIAID